VAYDALPPVLQQRLHGLRAIYHAGVKQYASRSTLTDAVRDLPDVSHPAMRTHPITGRKAIYVRAGECVGIVGMSEEEALQEWLSFSPAQIAHAFGDAMQVIEATCPRCLAMTHTAMPRSCPARYALSSVPVTTGV
jgi:hypothetical protein